MKHTKGKWFPRKCTDGEIDIASHLSETMESPSIAIVQPVSSMLAKVGGGTTEANARLIASAPDMLEALLQINNLELDDSFGDHKIALLDWAKKVGKIARTAIAKAEGK